MKDDIEQNLFWLLIRASLPAKLVFIRMGELHKLNHQQLFGLCIIDKDGETPLHTIASMLGCDASTVTGVTEKLVKEGYVQRTECERDRRIKLVRLTEKGKATREQIMLSLAQNNSTLLDGLTDEDKQTLRTILNKVLTNCPGCKSQ